MTSTSLLGQDFLAPRTAGGIAVAAVCSVEDADEIVKIALDKFGSVHILVANAGIVRGKSFASMADQEWDIVLGVHLRYAIRRLILSRFLMYLRGTYKCAKALWPVFQKQKYGRIVTTASQLGIRKYPSSVLRWLY